ncbi:MAG: iron transporter [Deltaproteobacteria bacterium]|nr:iron transporter [Deltaproteobacteria bacterium]
MLQSKLGSSIQQGLRKGWDGFIWLLKIILPISFLTLMFEYSGLFERAEFILEPVMGLMQLPPAAALPLAVGLLAGIYGAIAAIAVLPFTTAQITVMAVFLLIAHNLVQESIIQGKAGVNPITATLVRLVAALGMAAIIGRLLIPGEIVTTAAGPIQPIVSSFSAVISGWITGMLVLCTKMLVIILGVMIVIEIMKAFNVVSRIVGALRPLLKIMGVDQSTGMLWLTAALFGLAFGAAIIVEETKNNRFERSLLERLHISIGINHSIVEDPVLFLPFGIHPFWLWVPRLLCAMLATWLYIGWHKIRPRQKTA